MQVPLFHIFAFNKMNVCSSSSKTEILKRHWEKNSASLLTFYYLQCYLSVHMKAEIGILLIKVYSNQILWLREMNNAIEQEVGIENDHRGVWLWKRQTFPKMLFSIIKRVQIILWCIYSLEEQNLWNQLRNYERII